MDEKHKYCEYSVVSTGVSEEIMHNFDTNSLSRFRPMLEESHTLLERGVVVSHLLLADVPPRTRGYVCEHVSGPSSRARMNQFELAALAPPRYARRRSSSPLKVLKASSEARACGSHRTLSHT